jgi:hypothetical protein
MPCFKISYRHSRMPREYVGCSIKYANNVDDAIRLLGKYCSRSGTVVDKRGSVLNITGREIIEK